MHKVVHSDLRQHKCNQCGKLFKTSKDVKKHLSVHSDERKFKCSVCSAKFKRKDHCTKHEKDKHGRVQLTLKKTK